MDNRRRFIALSGFALASSGSNAMILDLHARETSFARTMESRDEAGFASFLDPQAIFINGGKPLRGKEQVMAVWAKYFREPSAPFSWKPEIAEVMPDGMLGLTEGPVFSPDGTLIARFYSVWRRRLGGEWMLAFDNGYSVPVCR